MYLFKKKVKARDVLSCALETSEKVARNEKFDENNEPWLEYAGPVWGKAKQSKYKIDEELDVTHLEASPTKDDDRLLVTLAILSNEECHAQIHIRVITPIRMFEKKYAKLNIGDKVHIRGLVDLLVIDQAYSTLVILTILES